MDDKIATILELQVTIIASDKSLLILAGYGPLAVIRVVKTLVLTKIRDVNVRKRGALGNRPCILGWFLHVNCLQKLVHSIDVTIRTRQFENLRITKLAQTENCIVNCLYRVYTCLENTT